MNTPFDPKILAEIATFDVPTISNAIEFFQLRPKTQGYTNPQIRSIFGTKKTVVAYAATAKMSGIAPPTDHQKTLLGDYYRLLRATPKPTMAVIQDIDAQPVGSLWGEVNATLHKALGCVGVVTNGGVRDLDEVRAIGFDYFASCVLVSHANVHIEAVGGSVQVGGLGVAAGDLVAADQHGVVLIPAAAVPRLPEACRAAQKAELPMLEPCRALIAAGELADPEQLLKWRAAMVAARASFKG